MDPRARLLPSLCLLLFIILTAVDSVAQKWTTPTAEELSMTEQTGAPGVAAVLLDYGEWTDDNQQTFTFYNRIKILKESALKAATIKLRSAPNAEYGSRVRSFEGRTIQPDGTVISMTDPPADETITYPNVKIVERTYQLPAAEVGSILEYRYTIALDHHVQPPIWILQREYYVRKAHFEWHALAGPIHTIVSGEVPHSIDMISFIGNLPPGVEVKRVKSEDGRSLSEFVLDSSDIPAFPTEEDIPPESSFLYQVRFYFAHDTTANQHWKDQNWKEAEEGWSKAKNQFDEPASNLKRAAIDLLAPTDTPEQKLRKIYAAVMKLDNLDADRDQGKLNADQPTSVTAQNAYDVLIAGRGSNDQINSVFVSMARAVGFTAYVMRVSNRDRWIFNPDFLSMGQFDDDIAIIELNGKEQFLDPGTRFCPFGHLGWRHAATSGIRQTGNGAEIAQTPQEPVEGGQIQRIANLSIDAQGLATGTLKISYVGTSAIDWRQIAAIYGDDELKKRVKEQLEKTLPEGSQVDVSSIDNEADFELPLILSANLRGPIGSVDGSQIQAKADLFEARSTPPFQPESRKLPVSFPAREYVRDAIRISFPNSVHLKSAPADLSLELKEAAEYKLSAESTPTSVTIHRSFALGRLDFDVAYYPDVRGFYQKVAAKDQDSVIFELSPAGTGNL